MTAAVDGGRPLDRDSFPRWKWMLIWLMGPTLLAFGLSARFGLFDLDRPRRRHRWLYDLLGPDGLAVLIAAIGLLFTITMILIEVRIWRARRGR